jgi:GNAT superfamily N-acetyltransferase
MPEPGKACAGLAQNYRVTERPVVTRIGEDGWRAWRAIRLAMLADAPDCFAGTVREAESLGERDWRAMTREGAIFLAAAGPQAVGVVAGLPREPALECGLGSMWVAPAWRGRGVAPMLAAAVIAWARSRNCARVGLWVPADNARARAFYERTGFRPTGQALPFPGAAHRTICEMKLDLAAGP